MTSSFAPWDRDPIELLVAAIRSAQEHPETRDFELGQLWGSLTGDPALQEVFRQETAPLRAHADFRLTGSSVVGHSVDADLLIGLIGGVTEATIDTAKEDAEALKRQKSKAHPISLGSYGRPLIVTAIEQGSVRFALEVADRGEDTLVEGAARIPGFTPADLDDDALRKVIEVLFSDGSADALQTIPIKAQRALAPAAEAIAEHGLEVEVEVRQRHRPSMRRSVDRIAAKILFQALLEPVVSAKSRQGVFQFDGYKESEQAIFLMIDGESKRVTAEPGLISSIRTMQRDDDEKLWLSCDLVITIEDAPGKQKKTHRQLNWAEKVAPPKPDFQQSLDFPDKEAP